MKLFEKLLTKKQRIQEEEKTAPSVPWRNSTGKIKCTKGYCNEECESEKNCPIMFNTIGITMFNMKQLDMAIDAFQSALALAPDFQEAQYNLGMSYGMSDQHQEAYTAFKAAYDMDKNSHKSLFNLIVAETNLGLKEDALKHCDEYDKFPECDSKDLRKKLKEQKETSKESHYLDILPELLNIGRKEGFIRSEDIAYIPELLTLSADVCLKLCHDINEYGKEHPEIDTLSTSFQWCAYAGMGAVFHWNLNWDDLAKKGIYETLTEERGVYEMDEYVLDTIGIGYDSPEGEILLRHIIDIADRCIDIIAIDNGEISSEIVINAIKAMFIYGMIFEMNRLGMR